MMWLVLVASSCCELGFAVFMKLSDSFKNLKYTVLTILATSLSIYLLSVATRVLPLGPAYAVWTGLGTVFNVLFGIFVFHEDHSFRKLLFLSMVLLGVIGLRICG
ncbi:MAG: multidrug efflux SMR transporter [Ruminococcaceae bacterium]|nr:multidrug efflux SMR transporter [Oscillospiraceae bacterium]